MNRIVVLSPRAELDIEEMAEHLAKANPRVAYRFLDAVETTCAKLVGFPESGFVFETENPRLQELRVHLIKGFPSHLIFYRPTEMAIEIVHVLHGARDLEKYTP